MGRSVDAAIDGPLCFAQRLLAARGGSGGCGGLSRDETGRGVVGDGLGRGTGQRWVGEMVGGGDSEDCPLVCEVVSSAGAASKAAIPRGS
jgi:hypothetical protein